MQEHKPLPPKAAERFLCWFLKTELLEEVLGDLEEKFYHTLHKKSLATAKLGYWYQVIRYLRPFAVKTFRSKHSNQFSMYSHNVKIAYRHIGRNKTSFVINLSSLVLGISCALLIYLWTMDELGVDKFHEHNDRLVQVLQNDETPNGIITEAYTQGILAKTLIEEVPQVEKAVSVVPYEWFEGEKLLVSGGRDKIFSARNQFAQQDYFKLFSFDFIHGSAEQALKTPNQVVITRRLAEKLYGSYDVVGRSLEWIHDEYGGLYNVSGVLHDLPVHSTQQFDAVFHYDVFLEENDDLTGWSNSSPYTYALLTPGARVDELNASLQGFLENKLKRPGQSLFAQAFADRYLYGRYENGRVDGGRIAYVKLFSMVAALILLVACINFMNMTTAEATKRIKEIGIKKAIGVHRKSLMAQYIVESMLITFIATLIALSLVYFLLPAFNVLTGKNILFSLDPTLLLSLCSILLVTGFVAGAYPALYLSGFSPIKALKGKIDKSNMAQPARRVLVIFQFTISTLMLVFMVVISQQIQFIQAKNLGYDKENLVWFTAGVPAGDDKTEGLSEIHLESLLQALKSTPGVVNASNFAHHMVGEFGTTTGVKWPGKDPDKGMLFVGISAGYDFINTMNIEVKEGRSYARSFKTDHEKIIFNEAAIEAMGLQDPLGKVITLWGDKREIIGVTKDFHVDALYEEIQPTFIKLDTDEFAPHIMVKLEAGQETQAIDRIERVFKQFFVAGMPFEFKFLDDNFQQLYAQEIKMGTLSKYAAGVVALISGLGLFGFANFTVNRRIKEIGIRKVFGATQGNVVYLLLLDFTKLVLIALAVALPAAFLMAKDWLNEFAFRVSLDGWIFLGTGLTVIVFSWAAVGWQTTQAALLNPAESLKDE